MDTLVLFDIDGTLVNKNKNTSYQTRDRFVSVFEEIFHVTPKFDWKELDGQGDRRIYQILAQDAGIDPQLIDEKMPEISQLLVKRITEALTNEHIYDPIVDALTFIHELKKIHSITIGIISGNFRATGRLKLRQVGIADLFSFDIYADDALNRNAMAELVIPKAEKELHISLHPRSVFIIGDTVHDIRSAKAANLRSIAVNSGPSASYAELQNEKPELLVKSLLDPQVMNLIRSNYE